MLLSKARRGRKEKKKGLVDNNTSHSSQMDSLVGPSSLKTHTYTHTHALRPISLVGLYAIYFLELQEWDSMELS